MLRSAPTVCRWSPPISEKVGKWGVTTNQKRSISVAQVIDAILANPSDKTKVRTGVEFLEDITAGGYKALFGNKGGKHNPIYQELVDFALYVGHLGHE